MDVGFTASTLPSEEPEQHAELSADVHEQPPDEPHQPRQKAYREIIQQYPSEHDRASDHDPEPYLIEPDRERAEQLCDTVNHPDERGCGTSRDDSDKSHDRRHDERREGDPHSREHGEPKDRERYRDRKADREKYPEHPAVRGRLLVDILRYLRSTRLVRNIGHLSIILISVIRAPSHRHRRHF